MFFRGGRIAAAPGRARRMQRHPRGPGWPGRRTGGRAWGSCWLRPTHLAARGNRGAHPPPALAPLSPLSLASPPHPHFHHPTAPPLASARPAESTGMGGGARFVIEKMGFWGGRGGGGGAAAGPRPQLPPLTPPPLLALFHPSPPPSGCTHTFSLTSLEGGGRPAKRGKRAAGGSPSTPSVACPPPLPAIHHMASKIRTLSPSPAAMPELV